MKRRGFLKAVGTAAAAPTALDTAEQGSETVTKEVDIGTDKALVNSMTGEVVVPADPTRTVEITYEKITA